MSAFIEARELRKTYRVGKMDVPALRGVSFSVQKGEFVSIVGPSGSGKSTLFYLLGGLTRADGGSVTIDGVDFATLSDADPRVYAKARSDSSFRSSISCRPLALARISRLQSTSLGKAFPTRRSCKR